MQKHLYLSVGRVCSPSNLHQTHARNFFPRNLFEDICTKHFYGSFKQHILPKIFLKTHAGAFLFICSNISFSPISPWRLLQQHCHLLVVTPHSTPYFPKHSRRTLPFVCSNTSFSSTILRRLLQQHFRLFVATPQSTPYLPETPERTLLFACLFVATAPTN